MSNLEQSKIVKIKIRRSPKPNLNQIEALSKQELLIGIEQLRKHTRMLRNIVKDFRKLEDQFKDNYEVIERYQLMKQDAIYELKDYISTLRRNYYPRNIIFQTFDQ
jgi:hypothetical protein